MVSELVYTIIRIGYLALMWLFVLAAVLVLRRDVFGTVVIPRGRGRVPSEEASEVKAAGNTKRKKHREQVLAPKYLLVTDGPLTGTTLPLTDAPILVGRSPACTLVIDDAYASSQHARLFSNGGTWFIEDLDSTNGTFVDGVQISQPQVIDQSSNIRIGQTTMELSR